MSDVGSTDVVTAFIATVPAGSSGHTVSLNVGDVYVSKVRWRVPPGPRGHLAWYIAQSGAQVLPSTLGTAIVADDEWDYWDTTGLPESGSWALIGTNSGTYDHSVYLEFFTTPTAAVSGGGGGNVLAGFPVSDADLPGMWLGGPAPILA